MFENSVMLTCVSLMIELLLPKMAYFLSKVLLAQSLSVQLFLSSNKPLKEILPPLKIAYFICIYFLVFESTPCSVLFCLAVSFSWMEPLSKLSLPLALHALSFIAFLKKYLRPSIPVLFLLVVFFLQSPQPVTTDDHLFLPAVSSKKAGVVLFHCTCSGWVIVVELKTQSNGKDLLVVNH